MVARSLDIFKPNSISHVNSAASDSFTFFLPTGLPRTEYGNHVQSMPDIERLLSVDQDALHTSPIPFETDSFALERSLEMQHFLPARGDVQDAIDQNDLGIWNHGPVVGDTVAGDPLLSPRQSTTGTLQNIAQSTSLSTDPDGDGIFGSDNREAVQDATQFPFSAVVRLAVRWDGADGILNTSDDITTTASGAMVSDFHVLTAGHVIFNQARGGWADEVEVIAGSGGDIIPEENRADNEFYGRANHTYLRSYQGWTQDQNYDYDLGLITLDRNLGDYTGHFGYGYDDGITVGESFNVAGYPGDRFDSDGDSRRDNYNMSYQFGQLSGTTDLTLQSTDLDLIGGNSGGPLWQYDSTTGSRTIYGVASNTTTDRDTGVGLYNEFVRINSSRFDDLQRWIQDDVTARNPTDHPDFVDYDSWFNTDYAFARNNSTGNNAFVEAGDSFTLQSYIRNNGTTAYNGLWLTAPSFSVTFYASTNDIISEWDYELGTTTISSIQPFEWETARWTGLFPDIPEDDYYIGWIIEADHLGESETSNNTGILDQTIRVA